MIYAQTRIRLKAWNAQNSLGFWDTNRSPNSDQKTKPSVNQLEKRICHIVDLAVPEDRVKMKESKMINKEFLPENFKKLGNI